MMMSIFPSYPSNILRFCSLTNLLALHTIAAVHDDRHPRLLTPAAAAPDIDLPAGHAHPGCAARSEAPLTFSLGSLRFTVSGPTETARLTFDLTNIATNYTSRDGLWLPCGDVSESSGVAARGEYCNLETLVLFKRYGGGGGGDGDGDDEESHARISFRGTSDTKLANIACVTSDPTWL
ncbi:hypothetical protein UCREL1_2104 [Eutypa lata UCREL1]|uniref:Uncharacterized protein n=1 Tax=Eutypa lata (strain UCR-EL1) TaxID=1287681 RepID=M7T1X7_EUTLA|nr:hypothetical protein UCREL1_2104 [Eutypa lata UCREL1]